MHAPRYCGLQAALETTAEQNDERKKQIAELSAVVEAGLEEFVPNETNDALIGIQDELRMLREQELLLPPP